MSTLDEQAFYERITLAKERIVAQEVVARCVYERGIWRDIESYIDDHLTRQVTFEVLTHTDTFTCPKYPSNWWQAFRERWLPAWWLARYPVSYAEPIVAIKAKYPTLTVGGMEHRAYVDVVMATNRETI